MLQSGYTSPSSYTETNNNGSTLHPHYSTVGYRPDHAQIPSSMNMGEPNPGYVSTSLNGSIPSDPGYTRIPGLQGTSLHNTSSDSACVSFNSIQSSGSDIDRYQQDVGQRSSHSSGESTGQSAGQSTDQATGQSVTKETPGKVIPTDQGQQLGYIPLSKLETETGVFAQPPAEATLPVSNGLRLSSDSIDIYQDGVTMTDSSPCQDGYIKEEDAGKLTGHMTPSTDSGLSSNQPTPDINGFNPEYPSTTDNSRNINIEGVSGTAGTDVSESCLGVAHPTGKDVSESSLGVAPATGNDVSESCLGVAPPTGNDVSESCLGVAPPTGNDVSESCLGVAPPTGNDVSESCLGVAPPTGTDVSESCLAVAPPTGTDVSESCLAVAPPTGNHSTVKPYVKLSEIQVLTGDINIDMDSNTSL